MILTLVTRERVNPDGVAFQVPGLTRPLDESIIPSSCSCREKGSLVCGDGLNTPLPEEPLSQLAALSLYIPYVSEVTISLRVEKLEEGCYVATTPMCQVWSPKGEPCRSV